MSIGPFPVPDKFVPQYGRGRSFFPAPIEFQVPVLCRSMQHDTPLFFYVVDVNTEWESWGLALPQSSDNHVICYAEPVVIQPADMKGRHKPRLAENGYMRWTVAELRRRLPQFWRNASVLMIDDTWLPMELADPFNLLGFTCLPSGPRTIPLAQLPTWKQQDATAVTYIKPLHINTPVNVASLVGYLSVPAVELAVSDIIASTDVASAKPSPVLEALVIGDGSRAVTVKQLKEQPTVVNMRDYLQNRLKQRGPAKIATMTDITDAYYHSDADVAYLCTFPNLAEPIWVAARLLELLEVNDLGAYAAYRTALDNFHDRLERLA